MTKDYTGETFGRLTALHPEAKRTGHILWRFMCVCGNEKSIRMHSVLSGVVKSCGCLHLDRCRDGLNRVRHGDARVGRVARLHSIWRDMLKRCNPANNAMAIERYAARGIRVCDEWQAYPPFKAWALANGYSDNLSIERQDIDGPYSPENCRWATKKEQSRNRSTSRWITVDGETKCLAEWLEQTGTGPSAFYSRMKRGWAIDRALGLR